MFTTYIPASSPEFKILLLHFALYLHYVVQVSLLHLFYWRWYIQIRIIFSLYIVQFLDKFPINHQRTCIIVHVTGRGIILSVAPEIKTKWNKSNISVALALLRMFALLNWEAWKIIWLYMCVVY
jgi:hypothetical protein